MKKILSQIIIITVLFLILPLYSSNKINAEKNNSWYTKKFFIDPEFGAGHLANLSFGIKLKSLYLGISGGFDAGSFNILGEKYDEFLINASGLLGYQVFQNKLIWSDVYLKAGYDMYSVSGGYSAGGVSLDPGLKLGFSGLFVDLCFPITLGLQKPLSMFQMGIGWRIKIGKNS